jgi:hypothetical protein
MDPAAKSHILVDLDGTLALYEHWEGITKIGEPVPAMVRRVKDWIAEGRDVRIFTARVFPIHAAVGETPDPKSIGQFTWREIEAWQALTFIRAWSVQHIGQELAVTCQKSFDTAEIWDDRAVGVIPNRGIPVETVPALYLHNLVRLLGILVADGDSYQVIAERARQRIIKMNTTIAAFDEARTFIDAAHDALQYVKPEALVLTDDQVSKDIKRGQAALAKAMPFMESKL